MKIPATLKKTHSGFQICAGYDWQALGKEEIVYMFGEGGEKRYASFKIGLP